MSEVHAGERADGAVRRGSGVAGALNAADWLGLAAAPSFAAMALLTAYSGGPEMVCMSVPHVSPFTGMALMYLLMSVFHLAPWLKLLPSRRLPRAT